MPTLADDVIENILEHVYGSYISPQLPTDLSRCALVCRTWHTIARPLMFHQLRIDLQDKRIRVLGLYPHLRQYVRQVWVGNLGEGSEGLVQNVLYPIPNVEELYLLEYSPDPSVILDPSTSDALLRNLTLLGLSEIDDFPVEYFYHCSALRHLKISNCTFDLECEPLSGDSPRPQLRSLYIAGDTVEHIQVLEWMSSPQSAFDLTRLKSFRSEDESNEDIPYTWTQGVLNLCGSAVQNLMVDPPTTYAAENIVITPEALPNPSTLSNLRVFTISILQATDETEYTNYIPWLNAFFSRFPTPNRLEEIRIQCTLTDLPEDDEELADHMGSYDWESLDRTLNESHLKLKKVVIGVQEAEERERDEDLINLLRNCNLLPGLEDKGILVFVNATPDEDLGYFSSEDHWWDLGS